MNLKHSTSWRTGFTAALAVLCLVAWLNWRHTHRMQATAERVAHTHRVQAALNRLFSLVKDIEAGARGFVITGDPHFLAPHEDGLRAVASQQRELAAAILDAEQKANLSELERLMAARIAAAQRNVELRRSRGFEAAREHMLQGEGKALMDRIRAQFARMDVREQALLDERSAAAARETATVRRLTVAGTLLSLLLLAGVFALLVRENRLRARSEREVQELNDRLQRRATQLQDANKELEAFSYSVSHDLRAPLRHVQGYVELLTNSLDGQLSGKSRRYLQTISAAGLEMGQLIDDLLAFSRMGRAEMMEMEVDLSLLVAEIRQDLELPEAGRNIQWSIAPLPVVKGDPAMLRQVFANLLSNAVKYTRRRDPAVIRIGVEPGVNGEVTLSIHDNGAGFDMQYVHKLFGVFQRLHRAEEFEGTGIGLATVRRIISRHGGRIWAEGVPGRGATFHLTLRPVAQPEASAMNASS
jgi:signal transduction histidine kinase